MPWLLLFRLILSVATEDLYLVELLEKLTKNSMLLKRVLNNPAYLIRIFNQTRLLGKGEKYKELTNFQENLYQIVNYVNVKKKINTYVKNNNVFQLQNLQQKFKQNINTFIAEKEAEKEINNDENIGVYVSLSSSALLGGLYIPVIAQQSGIYGIASLTYITNAAKSYDYFNVAKSTWDDMVAATGSFGTGANSVFIRQYLGGSQKTRKEMKAQVRSKVTALNRAVTKPSKTVLFSINQSYAKEGYNKYGQYGLKKKKRA